MSNVSVSFYRLDTGLPVGQTYTGPEAGVSANTPAGCGAFEGLLDHLAERVDLKTGERTPWQPDPPPDDEWQTWAWSDKTRRWEPQPTLAAIKRDAAAPLKAGLVELDLKAIRSLTEITLAMGAGTAAPEDAKTALQAIEQEKAALRAQIEQIGEMADPKAERP